MPRNWTCITSMATHSGPSHADSLLGVWGTWGFCDLRSWAGGLTSWEHSWPPLLGDYTSVSRPGCAVPGWLRVLITEFWHPLNCVPAHVLLIFFTMFFHHVSPTASSGPQMPPYLFLRLHCWHSLPSRYTGHVMGQNLMGATVGGAIVGEGPSS